MNDYKELIGDIGDLLIAHPSEHISKRYLQKAADAIEQLVRERDKLQNDLWEANDCLEYANDILKKVETERDTAVADLKEICMERYLPAACDYCYKHGKQVCKHCDWEWRGVQK